MKQLMKILLSAICTNFCSAHAAAPLNTDDAGALLSPAPLCQINLYTRHARNATASGIAPDCNIEGNTEWSVALDRLKPDQAPSQLFLTIQGKAIIRPVEPHGWGWGLNAGLVNEMTGKPFAQSAYGNLIYGFAPTDSLQFDFNIGALRNRSESGNGHKLSSTWAVAVEKDIGPGLTLVAETFGEQHLPTSWQIGARMPFGTNQSHFFNLAIGNQRGAGHDSAWLQIGFTETLDRQPGH